MTDRAAVSRLGYDLAQARAVAGEGLVDEAG